MKIKKLLIVLAMISGNASADAWGPDLIKFSLEGGPKYETMLWISGFSYAATAMHQRHGCISKSAYIESKYLIEKLNMEYAGKTITSEQATATLDAALSQDYPCKPYNKSLKEVDALKRAP